MSNETVEQLLLVRPDAFLPPNPQWEAAIQPFSRQRPRTLTDAVMLRRLKQQEELRTVSPLALAVEEETNAPIVDPLQEEEQQQQQQPPSSAPLPFDWGELLLTSPIVAPFFRNAVHNDGHTETSIRGVHHVLTTCLFDSSVAIPLEMKFSSQQGPSNVTVADGHLANSRFQSWSGNPNGAHLVCFGRFDNDHFFPLTVQRLQHAVRRLAEVYTTVRGCNAVPIATCNDRLQMLEDTITQSTEILLVCHGRATVW